MRLIDFVQPVLMFTNANYSGSVLKEPGVSVFKFNLWLFILTVTYIYGSYTLIRLMPILNYMF